MTAPTSYTGYVDDAPMWGNVLADATEQIADLNWPASVYTYGLMRRDPQLAAVLKAVTLPIRRATWQVDPAGASPEATQLVADGLGLAVKDDGYSPTGARVRGVRWSEHCRLALLDLVFGHFVFEERYDVTDGKTAKLAGLSERMPQTIELIAVNDDGTLKHIQQYGQPSRTTKAIPAAHLLWYAHEREGSAYQGTSLLRPAYAPWLLKREMLRALATGNRRFNAGVPTVEWAPGSDPTPAQMVEAQQYASAARVGDQSGGSLPPGATLKLVGLTGGSPDTLGFIRYLDQQMSRLALAGMLDLGETPNGSRALGAEFVDLFLLTIQAVAEAHAEEVTSQTAARIVAYNHGDGVPVPVVCVSDVGSKREVTAEALRLLLESGAVGPDPALDAWVRREWRLPERVGPYPADRPELEPPAELGRSRPLEVAAAAGARRAPTAVEAAAGVDFDALEGDWQAALDSLLEQWQPIQAEQRAAVLEAVDAAVAGGDVTGLARVQVDTDPAARVLTVALEAAAERAATRLRAEARKQGVTIPRRVAAAGPWSSRLAAVAKATAAVVAGGLVMAAARAALRVFTPDRPATGVVAAVADHLASLSQAFLAEQLGGALTAAQNAGRLAAIEAAPTEPTLRATEFLDSNTCGPCRDVDGHVYGSLDEARAVYANGGYVGCQGGLRCRGVIFATWD